MFSIQLDRSSTLPIYLQIRNSIREMIVNRTLPAGYRLPPERKLADELGVNRSTVLNAYRELKADGLIDSRVGQGTVVTFLPSAGTGTNYQTPEALPWRQYYSMGTLRTGDSLARDIMELANRRDVISFAAGIIASGNDPADMLPEIQSELLRDHGHTILQHTSTEGLYRFRESLCEMMKSRKISVSPEEVMVLSGSQQGLDYACRMLLDEGDVVFVEEPTYFCALQIFKALGARVVGVPTDKHGMRTDALEALLARYKPKMIYTMPTFQNPSGRVMSMERRLQLLQLAYTYRIPILEDDAYYELRYEGNTLPPLKALDQFGYVIYLSTFSKVLFQGFRLGWVAAPRQVIHQFSLMKQVTDLHSSSLAQWTMDALLRKGMLEAHIQKVRQVNRNRRDTMVEALNKCKLPGVAWEHPEGGLYVWCEIPAHVSLSRLVAKAAEHGVAFVPGEVFYPGGQGSNHIRLNFSLPGPDQIKTGVSRLMQALEEVSAEKRWGLKECSAGDHEIKPII